ncbi:uncharacterized protein ACB058_014860 isoform 1-T1 [Synchiropus picturatus]
MYFLCHCNDCFMFTTSRGILYVFVFSAGVSDVDAASQRLTGKEGDNITITCSHSNAYSNTKFFCTTDCSLKGSLMTSKGPNTAKYRIIDRGNDFDVTIYKLEVNDSGTYWCGIDRVLKDTYNGVHLTVVEKPREEKKEPDEKKNSSATMANETVAKRNETVNEDSENVEVKNKTEEERSVTETVEITEPPPSSEVSDVDADDLRLTGMEGEDITLRCSHSNAYRNTKYFCRGACSYKDVLITSKGPKTAKYHITDRGNYFDVTISNLEVKDSGLYWCGIDRVGRDTYNRVDLTVVKKPVEEKKYPKEEKTSSANMKNETVDEDSETVEVKNKAEEERNVTDSSDDTGETPPSSSNYHLRHFKKRTRHEAMFFVFFLFRICDVHRIWCQDLLWPSGFRPGPGLCPTKAPLGCLLWYERLLTCVRPTWHLWKAVADVSEFEILRTLPLSPGSLALLLLSHILVLPSCYT